MCNAANKERNKQEIFYCDDVAPCCTANSLSLKKVSCIEQCIKLLHLQERLRTFKRYFNIACMFQVKATEMSHLTALKAGAGCVA